MFSVDSVNVDDASDSAVLRGEVHDSLDETKEPDIEALRSFDRDQLKSVARI